MDVNKVVKAYLKMRQTKHDLKKKYEEENAKLEEKMSVLEVGMLQYLKDNNIDSIKTSAGTFYRQEEITPTGSDWDTFYNWIVQNDAFEALERRIKKTFIKQYMDAHEGSIPPGVSVYREYVVRVRTK